jgi:hypothetical protein
MSVSTSNNVSITLKMMFGSHLWTMAPKLFNEGDNKNVSNSIFFHWNTCYTQYFINKNVAFNGQIMWRWGNTKDGGYIELKFNFNHGPPYYFQSYQDKNFGNSFWSCIFFQVSKIPNTSTSNRASVVHVVVIVHNEKGVF